MTTEKSNVIAPFNDKLINMSKGLTDRLGFSKALILHHVWITFAYHYDNKELPFFGRPCVDGEEAEAPRSWVYFTIGNFERHIMIDRRNILRALSDLERGGWIEVHRHPGKRTLYRPSIRMMCLSSVYREEGAAFEREPDRYVDPSETGPEKGPVEKPGKQTGGKTSPVGKTTSDETPPVPVAKDHRYRWQNVTGSHIQKELRNEPELMNGSARTNALEVFDETRDEDRDREPAGEEGTGDAPGIWEEEMSHEERVDAAARAYLDQPMGKVQFNRALARFQVTLEEVRQRVAEIQAAERGKPLAKPSDEGGVGDDKGRVSSDA